MQSTKQVLPTNKITAFLSLFLGCFWLILAAILFFASGVLGGVDDNMRYLFVTMLALYGTFRLYTGLKALRKHEPTQKI